MSWFSDLADRAENILNKIDQNAAAVLQEDPKVRKFTRRTGLTVEPEPASDSDPVPAETPTVVEGSKDESDIVDFDASAVNGFQEETSTVDRDKYAVENAMLKNEISVVHNELSILLSKTKNAEKHAQDSHVRLAQIENAFGKIKTENETLRDRIAKTEHGVEASTDFDREIQPGFTKSEKRKLEDRINELEFTVKSLTSAKNHLEADIKMSQDTCIRLEEKLEKAKAEAANTLAEWKNYKIRANNTLAMKEKMIETLGGNRELTADQTVPLLNNQITQLKSERDQAVGELSHFKVDSDNKSREIDKLESDLRTGDKLVASLKDSLRQEKALRDVAEHALNNLTKELQTLQSETAKQISMLRSKLKDKATDVEKFHHSFGASESGEERIRSLTQALVGKQAALESVTADRNALRLQLEKTENKYRSDLVNMKNSQPRIINFNCTDDVKEKFPSLLQESPWDSRLSRKVKKAYSSLDSLSVRIGVFLRRNPIARIFIIAYMVILHLWVLVVLCTYTPEAHSK